jgi:signal transduction histidine kinase
MAARGRRASERADTGRAETVVEAMPEQTDSASARPIEGARSRSWRRSRDSAADADGAASGLRTACEDARPGVLRARLSHELRTPLNAILGNAELLLDGSAGPLSGQARACLGDIQVAGRRMLRQVQILLALCDARSRPEIAGDTVLDLIGMLRTAHVAALEPGPALEVVPAEARYLVPGEETGLGALAAALVEVYRGDGPARGRLRITVGNPAAPTDGVLRLCWANFDPEQLAALPAALIDAILDLHGGKVGLTEDGLEIDWPAARVVQGASPSSGVGCEPMAPECC